MEVKIRFLIRFFLFVGLISIQIGLINYYVDPGNVFSEGRYENRILDTLLSNKNANTQMNYNDRIFQKEFVGSLKKNPEIIILGASKVNQIHKDLFCDYTMINNSLGSAKIEDLLGVYGLYAKRNYFPKEVIFGIEPNYFLELDIPPSWLPLDSSYDLMLKILDSKPIHPIWKEKSSFTWSKIVTLWNWNYFITSIHYLESKIKALVAHRNVKDILGTLTIHNSLGETRNIDGSISHGNEITNVPPNEVNYKAIRILQERLPGMYNKTIDFKRISLFKKFISYLKSKNTRIIFVMCPFHPIVYDKIYTDSGYKSILEIEDYLKVYTLKNGMQIIGSFNPNILKLKDSDFYDGLHLQEKSLNKLLEPITGCIP